MDRGGSRAVGRREISAAGLVAVSLVLLFLSPPGYFVPGTLVVTSEMIALRLWIRGTPRGRRLPYRDFAAGVISAGVLYGLFFVGNAAVGLANIPGLSSSSKASIYGLIANPSTPVYVQVLVLLFDAVGYEAFFRDVLQRSLQQRWGVVSAPVVALVDSGLHVATLNPLWVATTFVADLVWGVTYFYGKGVRSSTTSHFVWDVAIFLLRPIT